MGNLTLTELVERSHRKGIVLIDTNIIYPRVNEVGIIDLLKTPSLTAKDLSQTHLEVGMNRLSEIKKIKKNINLRVLEEVKKELKAIQFNLWKNIDPTHKPKNLIRYITQVDQFLAKDTDLDPRQELTETESTNYRQIMCFIEDLINSDIERYHFGNFDPNNFGEKLKTDIHLATTWLALTAQTPTLLLTSDYGLKLLTKDSRRKLTGEIPQANLAKINYLKKITL